jgi:hypothetical protein
MTHSSTNRPFAALTLIATIAIGAAGCASTHPVAYSNLASSSQLRPNTQDTSGRVPYTYSETVDWRKYSQVIVEPVAVYNGVDAQFKKISDTDKEALAQYMQEQFTTELSERFHVVKDPSPTALRVRLTLTGAKASTQFVSTFMHFDLAGGPVNAIQGARGKEGMMMGSVSYAVEIYDSATNRLLNAYVEKQYPNAMNVKATFGSLSAAKTGIRKGAGELVAKLD